jgi:hypothetical protein
MCAIGQRQIRGVAILRRMIEKASRPRAIEKTPLEQFRRFLVSVAALTAGTSVLYVLLRA